MQLTQNMKEAMVAPVERFFVNMKILGLATLRSFYQTQFCAVTHLLSGIFWVRLYNLIKLGLQYPLRRIWQFWNLGECNEFVEFNTGCLLIVGVCVCNKRKLQTIQREKFKHTWNDFVAPLNWSLLQKYVKRNFFSLYIF